jgi:hypothetical protein
MHNIIAEINDNNGANYKMDVLRKHVANTELQRVLKLAYDTVTYTFGISMKNIVASDTVANPANVMSLATALDVLEFQLAARLVTGNAAIELLTTVINTVAVDSRPVVAGIINRDLRLNMGKSNINKVFKNLIVDPVYMRCGVFSKKSSTKINPKGAYVQLKADGTYREFSVAGGEVTSTSRNGERYNYPNINSVLCNCPDGHYIGELTVWENGAALDRATGNGMINSDSPPHDTIVLDLWDYVTPSEYTDVLNKVKATTPYSVRHSALTDIVNSSAVDVQNRHRIDVIETVIVDSFNDALAACSSWMSEGLEGAILKDANAVFKNGTSAQQLKMKLEIDIDVRITGFKEGKAGTKRTKTFGAMYFETDDGKIKGATSGFTDKQLVKFNNMRAELIGQVMTVCCNDITKGRSNDFYALSHPRFIELRNDKDTTDTIARALDTKEMATQLK